MGPDRVATCLPRLIAMIWYTEQLPEERKSGVINPTYKKGDECECENYRAKTIFNVAYKMLSQIIYRRLSLLASARRKLRWYFIRTTNSSISKRPIIPSTTKSYGKSWTRIVLEKLTRLTRQLCIVYSAVWRYRLYCRTRLKHPGTHLREVQGDHGFRAPTV